MQLHAFESDFLNLQSEKHFFISFFPYRFPFLQFFLLLCTEYVSIWSLKSILLFLSLFDNDENIRLGDIHKGTIIKKKN